MNSNQASQNSFPPLNTATDARIYTDSVRANLSSSWNSVEHALKTLQDKMNQIESLCAQLDERNSRITQLEGMLTDMQNREQQWGGLIRQRDQFIGQLVQRIQQRDSNIQFLTSQIQAMRTKIMSDQESGGLLLKENENLKAKLSQTGERNLAVAQEPGLTVKQKEALKDAIERELAGRASLITAKAKESVVKYQQRISVLEEQLRVLRAENGIDPNIDPSASGHLIENTPYNETNTDPDSNSPKNAMITLPNLDNDNPRHQQPSGPGYPSTSSIQPPQS